jgi:hypothetical protein
MSDKPKTCGSCKHWNWLWKDYLGERGECQNPAVVDGGNGTNAGVISTGNEWLTEANFGCIHHAES